MRAPMVLLPLLFLVGCQQTNGGFPDPETTAQPDAGKRDAVAKASNPAASGTFALSTGAKVNKQVGRLATELFRQTVLLVAADDFGLTIQDESLPIRQSDDDEMSGAKLVRFDVNPCLDPPPGQGNPRAFWAAEIRRRNNPDDRKSSERVFVELAPNSKVPRKLRYVGRRVRRRGRGDSDLNETVQVYFDMVPSIVEALKTCGYKRVIPEAETTLSEEDKKAIKKIELRLREMTFVAQFVAIRAAHDLPSVPRKHRLLAYGYANLGLLAQHHWSAFHKVFFARSLIHAERAFREDPGAASLAACAYSRALTGLHGAALDFLAARQAEPTPRLEAIDAFCHFDKAELLSLAQDHPEVRQLATLLACLVVDAAEDYASLLEVYEAAVKANPGCFRVYALRLMRHQIGLMHDITRRGPSFLVNGVPKRLKALENLPPEIEKVLEQETVLPAELADALQAVQDDEARQGMGWNLLGTLIRDEALVQAQRLMYLLDRMLDTPTAAAQKAFAEFVGEHELRVLALEPYADHPDWKKIDRSAKDYFDWGRGNSSDLAEFSNMGLQFLPLMRGVMSKNLPWQTRQSLLQGMWLTTDWTGRELALYYFVNMAWIRNDSWNHGDLPGIDPGSFLPFLRTLSPYHPQRFLRELRVAPSHEQLLTFEKELADRPALLDDLARTMMRNDMPTDALRVAKRLTKAHPSYDSFYILAHTYDVMGDEEKHIKYLKEAVKYPKPSLAPTKARTYIADYYMERGEFKKAEPFAAKAAKSYAEWAMICAIECYTGLEKYDLAEQWHIRRIKRYRRPPTSWYLWCLSTGHGHVKTARQLFEAMALAIREKPRGTLTASEAVALMGYYALKENDAAAADARASRAHLKKNPGEGLVAALFYLRAGQRDEALEILHESVEWTTSYETAIGEARRAGYFLETLESGKPMERSMIQHLDRAIETFPEYKQLYFHAVYGELFFFTGNPEQGIDFLKQALAIPLNADTFYGGYDRAFATIWLQERLKEQQTKTEAKAKGKTKTSEPSDTSSADPPE